MNKEKNLKETYESPSLNVVNVGVQRCIAASGDGLNENYSDENGTW